MKKIITWIVKHKIISAILLLALIFVGYRVAKGSGANTETRYLLGTVTRETLVSSISGTGQVSASNQVDLKSKTSNNLIFLKAKVGQEVKKGELLAEVDPGNSGYELESQKIAYDKLVTIDPDTLRKNENTLDQAQTSLADSYVTAKTTLTTASTNLTDVLNGLDDLFSDYLSQGANYGASERARGYLKSAQTFYYDASKQNSTWLKKNRALSDQTTRGELESLVSEANQVALAVAQAAKSAQDAVSYLKDNEEANVSQAETAYTTVTGLVTKVNAQVSTLATTKNSIENNKRALADAQAALAELKDGPEETDLRSATLSLRQKRDAYDDNFIRAPFDGIIASVPAHLGDEVTNSTVIATLISRQKIADISLNEVDAAKVTAGQKVTLTFDAVEDLSITGEVLSIDLVGTVSQGVVSYNVKIGFDTDDARIKPGMSTSAEIIEQAKPNVLVVPNSAIKTNASGSYVEVPVAPVTINNSSVAQVSGSALPDSPRPVSVQVGASNDTHTEIVSGLKEGDQVIVRTIAPGSQTTQTAPSLFGGGGSRGFRTGGGLH